MKEAKEKPPIAAIADMQKHYNQYPIHFTGVRNDLNRLISLQQIITQQLSVLLDLDRSMLAQLTIYSGGNHDNP